MATNSRISFERPDGTVRSIYCHWDGYPEHNGIILYRNYNEHNLDTLMDLGDLSSLGSVPCSKPEFWENLFSPPTPYCLAFKDRGENCPAKEFKSLSSFKRSLKKNKLDEECNYLFSKGQWFYWDCDYSKRNVRKLKEIIENVVPYSV